MVVIEMNPRVSRSSALASKATGFPIAKIAAKLAVGYTLDEIKNDITRETPACFEPTIDYCVVKVPRFTFEKFPQADATLTTRMKSVGEAMAIGRTFKEALQKALRSLEIKRFGLLGDGADKDVDLETLRLKLAIPNAERIFYIAQAFQKGASIDEVYELTKIDRWFLRNVQQIVEEERALHRGAGILPVGPAGVSPAEADKASRNNERAIPSDGSPQWNRKDTSQPSTLATEGCHVLRDIPVGRCRTAKHSSAMERRTRDTGETSTLNPGIVGTKYEYQKRFQESREHWLDRGHGECILKNSDLAEIVANALRHFDHDRYVLDAFVVMPNHVHVLVQLAEGQPLADSSSLVEIIFSQSNQSSAWKKWRGSGRTKATIELCGIGRIGSVPRLHRPQSRKAKLRKGEFVLHADNVLADNFDSAGETPAGPTGKMPVPHLLRAKKFGFSDRQLAVANDATGTEIRAIRKSLGITPTYRLVDTCAAEFEAYTPYYYSTYGDENERRESDKRKIMILGGGPNRIGQGIEFDYCCVHAAFALRELGFETIMVNSNPETVSTDYDTSDKLYFEPLTLEDVLNIYDQEQPEGVFVQFGGQTPLNLASGLEAAGVPILGTQTESIETAEDRKLFAAMLDKLGLRQTPNGSATSTKEAVAIAKKIGYPVLVRPSFVLGGRAMELVYTESGSETIHGKRN